MLGLAALDEPVARIEEVAAREPAGRDGLLHQLPHGASSLLGDVDQGLVFLFERMDQRADALAGIGVERLEYAMGSEVA